MSIKEVKTMAEQKTKSEPKRSEHKQGNGRHGGGAMAPFQSRSMLGAPIGPLGRLRSEFDRLFDEFFQGFPAWPTLAGGERQRGWGLDMQDRDDAVVVRADAPGFEPGDFDVEIRGDNLVLSASQSEEKSKDESGYEWQRREFYHSIPLPSEIDADKIDAKYHNGVLTITLPKSEPAKARKIQIKG
jgi:HSP20 family protein